MSSKQKGKNKAADSTSDQSPIGITVVWEYETPSQLRSQESYKLY
ncbi:unnamed protein product [Brassica oleracea]|uniref:Uncharacterized protein n=1 Tax=Brassica oleracea TaxID=3712 RepID=A0A3P6CUQ7_BRAOL|nr:unnamed protein product [Brassica oleracea]